MEEISNIFKEIKFNIKSLPFKAKSNTLIISVLIFLLYNSYDIKKQTFRKKAYDLLILIISIFLIFFNFSFVKNSINKYILLPILKYFFGEEEEIDTYEAKNLLK
jgi:TctA family transporter